MKTYLSNWNSETTSFDSVCFLSASLSRISKAKNCKEDTTSGGQHFQSSEIKKHPALCEHK